MAATKKRGALRTGLLVLGMAMAVAANSAVAAEPDKSIDADVNLTPQETAEKEARKACKVDICKALHSKDASGDIACHVIKSWRKEQLVKLVGKLKVTWPYDGAQCAMQLSVKRDDLVRARGVHRAAHRRLAPAGLSLALHAHTSAPTSPRTHTELRHLWKY